jgi:hypothetical protein
MKNRYLAFLFARFQEEQFVDDTSLSAKANGIANKSTDGAKLAAVRAASSELDRDDAKSSPAFTNFLQQCTRGLGNKVELIKIDQIPGNHGVLLQRRFALFAGVVNGRVDVFELTTKGFVRERIVRSQPRP